MIRRSVTQAIEHALQHQAAVALIGPRQVGKTTLAREIAGTRPGAVYLDLEARADARKLAEPRQVGKTTWAGEIPRPLPGAVSLGLEAGADRNKLAEPVLFLRPYENS